MQSKILKRIFISSPYTLGDVAVNVKKSMNSANELIEAGFAPYCPLLSHFLHMNNPQPYEKWLEIDITFLTCCSAVLKLEGKSAGSEIECKFANGINIPVFTTIEEIKKYFGEI